MLLQASSIVHIPPEIPTRLKDYDCGVYLLQFAKHIVSKKAFNFNSEHMEHFRQEMKVEFFTKKLGPVSYATKMNIKPNGKKLQLTQEKISGEIRRFVKTGG